MTSVFLTGLTGKSGSALVELLAQSDSVGKWELRTLVRTEADKRQLQERLPEAEIFLGDLADTVILQQVTQGVDVVFHIAGIRLSLNLVRVALANGVRRFVLVHTTGIYSKYKAAGEDYRNIEAEIDALMEQYGAGHTYLRPTMIYGNLQDHNMVQFIRMVHRFNPMPVVNHGAYWLQPVHYRDLGRAYYQVLKKLDETAGKHYILSGRDPIQLIDMLDMISKELGVIRRFLSVPFPLAYGGAWVVYLLTFSRVDMREKVQRLCEDRAYSHEAAQVDFGYRPIAFADGLREEVQAFLAAGGAP